MSTRDATEGMTYKLTSGLRAETTVYTVGPKCTEQATGHWVCATHGVPLAHNMEMQSHIEHRGDHTMVWVCHLHGPEVP